AIFIENLFKPVDVGIQIRIFSGNMFLNLLLRVLWCTSSHLEPFIIQTHEVGPIYKIRQLTEPGYRLVEFNGDLWLPGLSSFGVDDNYSICSSCAIYSR